MYDPFTSWMRMTSAALSLGRTALQMSESMSASTDVISERMAIIDRAVRSPLEGDYAELGRMLPEKVDAMAKASAAIAGECWSMQTAFWTQAQLVSSMMLRGRPPTLGELATLGTRNTAYALQTMDNLVAVGSGAVAPAHKAVTGNARRLKARRARATQ